jgi:hypothetical protein
LAVEKHCKAARKSHTKLRRTGQVSTEERHFQEKCRHFTAGIDVQHLAILEKGVQDGISYPCKEVLISTAGVIQAYVIHAH